MCHGFLNFDSEEINEEFEKMKGSHVGFFKLQEIIHDNLARHCKLRKMMGQIVLSRQMKK
jgi:hypothetical protein